MPKFLDNPDFTGIKGDLTGVGAKSFIASGTIVPFTTLGSGIYVLTGLSAGDSNVVELETDQGTTRYQADGALAFCANHGAFIVLSMNGDQSKVIALDGQTWDDSSLRAKKDCAIMYIGPGKIM